jgi:hypothetical protein
VPYNLDPEIVARYKDGIGLIEREFDHSERQKVILTAIEYCEQARRYDWEKDNTTRLADRNARKLVRNKNPIVNARELARFLEEFPQQTMQPIMAAILKSGVHLRTMADDPETINLGVAFSKSHSLRMARLLAEFANELASGALFAQTGPFMHRFRVGPLLYPKPVDGRTRQAGADERTCLAVFLSFLFRVHSLTGSFAYQSGETIPKEGNPRWPLVAQLVTDALGQCANEAPDYGNTVGKLISRHPDLRVLGYRQ